MRNFFDVALLNRNFAAVWCIQIDSGEGRGHVERNIVFFRKHCDGICPDLVRHIAVGGNTVRANDDGADFPLLHHCTRHAVGDHRGRDTVFHEFPCREP